MNPSTSSSRLSTPLTGPDAVDRKNAPVGSFKYYSLCGLGGALATGLTTSLYSKEVVVSLGPTMLSSGSVAGGVQSATGLRQIVSTPTFSGYLKKGVAKFGFYDGFKDLFAKAVPDAYQYRIPIYMCSALSAQTFASVWFDEVKRVHYTATGRRLTYSEFSQHPVNEEIFERKFPHEFRRMRNAVVQFPCFELATEALHGCSKPKANCSKSEQLAVTFAAGCIAGLACALVTHRADMRAPQRVCDCDRYAVPAVPPGIRAFASRSARMTMLVAAQWTIYEGFKIAMDISNQPHQYLHKSRKQPEMPESLRKKLEELKLKKMKEQTPKGDLSIHLTPSPLPYSE